MKIYAACLASYNNGQLHGEWIDLDVYQAADDIQEQINKVLESSPQPNAEEWAIHDYDDFPDMGEWPDLNEVAMVIEAIEEHGEAFELYWNDVHGGDIDDAIKRFQDAYLGEYDTPEDYAEQLLSDCYDLNSLPPLVIGNIDFKGIWNDLDCDGYHAAKSSSLTYHIFDGNA